MGAGVNLCPLRVAGAGAGVGFNSRARVCVVPARGYYACCHF
uniref:Uncharacterized protein n=1 Tax=Arundo donax TaxID=35708 RepID=A0A0A9GPB8_ARUDO